MTIYDHDVKALDGSAADLHDHEGKAAAHRQRGLQVRAHPAVRGPRAHPRAVRATGASPCSASRATSSWARSRARPRRSPPSARPPTASRSRCSRRSRSTATTGTRSTPSSTQTADAEGHSGDIRWNFEKFLVSPEGEVVARFAPAGRARGARARRRHRGPASRSRPALPAGGQHDPRFPASHRRYTARWQDSAACIGGPAGLPRSLALRVRWRTRSRDETNGNQLT